MCRRPWVWPRFPDSFVLYEILFGSLEVLLQCLWMNRFSQLTVVCLFSKLLRGWEGKCAISVMTIQSLWVSKTIRNSCAELYVHWALGHNSPETSYFNFQRSPLQSRNKRHGRGVARRFHGSFGLGAWTWASQSSVVAICKYCPRWVWIYSAPPLSPVRGVEMSIHEYLL